jgi:hypothetical protein
MLLFGASLMIVIDDTSQGLSKAWIITYNFNHSFIILATVIVIVNYDHETFIVQTTGKAIS